MADTTPVTTAATTVSTGITPEQLHAAIEKARLEERDKLRTKLDATLEANATLTDEVAKQKAAVQKLSDELVALKAAMKPDGGVDVAKAIEQAVQATTARFSEENATALNELRSQLETERSARTKLTLEQLRVKMIEDAGGARTLIPELVHGATEQELQSSIANSKAIFERTVAAVKPAASTPQSTHGNAGAGAPPTVPLPAGGGGSLPSGTTPQPVNVRALSNKDYAAHREALKKQATQRYPAAYITQ
jgi:hypothetical protein